MEKNYDVITFISKMFMNKSMNILHPCFLKKSLKTQNKFKKFGVMINMPSISVFLDKAKFADFW